MVDMVLHFLRTVWMKMWEDDILFLASGMAFNVLLCLLPILLLWMYVMGLWFRSSDSIHLVDRVLDWGFPDQPYTEAIRNGISAILTNVVADRRSFGVLSAVALLMTAASLFSSTRSVLHRVFAMTCNRPFFITWLVNIGQVLALTLLILGITSMMWLLRLIRQVQFLLPDLDHSLVSTWFETMVSMTSLPVIFLLCYLFYRHVPSQRIPSRVAMVAAGTTSLIWEVSGRLFGLYLGHLASYNRLYGAYAFILVLMLWIFYSSAIFVLGAEVGQVWRLRINHGKTPAPTQ